MRRRPKRSLGNVGDAGPLGDTRSVTLYVGRNIGPKSRIAQPDRCRRKAITRAEADRNFKVARHRAQTVKSKLSASRIEGSGWWEGAQEPSHQYTVILDGSSEKTLTQLKNNMIGAGEIMARDLCQDQIIMVVDNGDKRKSYWINGAPRKKNSK